jgi:crotonobetainyl-CoA:carnitine CoA-transferase CaiB-like acyl-CoA transferase
MSEDAAPLAGLRVVELSMYVQGPVSGLVLASQGADVIKIEQVGRQDNMRSMGSLYGVRLDERGQAWQYAALNRGKRSLALDIAQPGGRAVFRRLIEQADVFVTNLRQDALQRFGADWDTLSALNPRLVYGRGGGFGLDGPLAEDPCQDTVGMAYGGFMDHSSPTEEPNYPPGALSDVLTGTAVASAILTGLVKRSISGKGSLVGSSQVQSLLWMQLLPAGMAATLGETMTRFQVEAPPNPLFSVYPTADGWIAIAAIHPPQWPPIARVMGLEHLLEDERFSSFGRVIRHRAEFRPLLAERFLERPARHWWAELRAAGVWTSPVNRLGDLVDDEHVKANDYLVTFPDGFSGPPAPFEVGGWRGARTVAADYGEHTDAILTELGYGEEQLIELRVAEAIW